MNPTNSSEDVAMAPKLSGRKRRNGLAAFRAVEAEVRSALDAGWTLVAIYEEHQQRLAMSYAQFARYAQPLREAARSAMAATSHRVSSETVRRGKAAPTSNTIQDPGSGPPRGRPEEAVPTLDMDGFAAKALNNEDLF
jgi:hypothetical protein